MTKAEQVYARVEELVAGGTAKAEAFRQVAAESGIAVNSARGAYYQASRKAAGEGSSSRRPRRRETTPDDALSDARQRRRAQAGHRRAPAGPALSACQTGRDAARAAVSAGLAPARTREEICP